MQNNKDCLEPAGELHSHQEHPNLDHEVMQQLLEIDNSFSDSECIADLSMDFDDVPIDDVPMDVLCEVCCYFLFTEYDKARAHRAQLERMMGEPDRHELTENLKFHIRTCCLGFYATHLDNVISYK